MERIATITPIATRNTPFIISLMMSQRMPNTPKAVRIIKLHIANLMYCAVCLKFAVAVISSLFLIFLFFNADSRAEGVEFQNFLSASRLSDIFLCVFLSHRSFSFRLPHQGRDSEMQGFSGKILPVGLEIFLAKQEA